ncbi:uncharacterized protein LOC142775690 isoform X1 [Rhipicephalus microplus]|uniref:uncharacterized protein LOC142775690 isoform X1 n=1 Tax=Rhipicephalus microplus TaxID=6941 RepID=UPI003F6B8460
MDSLRLPGPLNTTGEASKNWQTFKQRFELFLAASEPSDKQRSVSSKTALLLSVAGEDAIEIFNTLSFTEGEDKADYATVIKKFDEYFTLQTNEVHERYVFRKRVQSQGEPFEHFLRDLKKQARACNFGTLLDSMVRDQIVYGTNDDRVREKLLRDCELTLQKAEHVCKAAEASALRQETWERGQKQVDAVRKAGPNTKNAQVSMYTCSKCGRTHQPGNCPAFGRTCRKCQKRNHFAICCRSSALVGEIQDHEDDFSILEVSTRGVTSQRDWTVRMTVNNVSVELKVDTGSQANLLPVRIYNRMHPSPEMKQSSVVLHSYGGDTIKHLGVIRTEATLGDQAIPLDFFVVRKGRQAILGLQASERLGLLSRVHSVSKDGREELVKDFRHLFTGTGCVKKVYHMVLQDNTVPVIQPVRRVPLALNEPLRDELDRMEHAGIITRVTEPTDWLLLADMLSRATTKTTACDLDSNDVEVHADHPTRVRRITR